MTTLSAAQLAVLTPALARENRCIYPIVAPLKGGAVGNVAKSLLRLGLLEEVVADDDASVWRCDDDGRLLTLIAKRETGNAMSDTDLPRYDVSAEANAEIPETAETPKLRAREILIALLRRPDGATSAEMTAATGWLPHSVRGALSGVIRQKLGHTVVSDKTIDRGRVYRIVS
jgi:hypothetical protein